MPTMLTHDRLSEAYDAWKRANDEHQEMMRSVMNGGLLDVGAMKQATRQLDALHASWMNIAQQRVCTRAGADA
jgi:hypothetical protein